MTTVPQATLRRPLERVIETWLKDRFRQETGCLPMYRAQVPPWSRRRIPMFTIYVLRDGVWRPLSSDDLTRRISAQFPEAGPRIRRNGLKIFMWAVDELPDDAVIEGEETAPIFIGRRHMSSDSRVELVTFRCPWCRRDHTHGFTSDMLRPEGSHRVAHCGGRGGPYGRHGYFVCIEPSLVEETRKAHEEHEAWLAKWLAKRRAERTERRTSQAEGAQS